MVPFQARWQAEPGDLECDADGAGDDERVGRELAQHPLDRGARGPESGEDEDAQHVDGGYDGCVCHRCERHALRPEQARRHGDADIIVEANPALENRREGGPIHRHERPRGNEEERGREHRPRQHERKARHRYAGEIGGGEPMDEESREEHEIAQPLGVRPERVGQEPPRTHGEAECDEQDDGGEREKGGADHGKWWPAEAGDEEERGTTLTERCDTRSA
jgi:hypothetical protein